MPYVITTRQPLHLRGRWGEDIEDHRESRVAVATLEEAMEQAWTAIDEMEASRNGLPGPSRDAYSLAVADLSESGGTIGPLPDGTIIEVESVSWEVLAQRFCMEKRTCPPVTFPAILAAFNAS